MIGIYKITNTTNGHSYIGQSVDIKKRWRAHRVCVKDTPLYRAFKKYSLENFTFEILEECGVDELNDREKYWIQFYDTYRNGYNQTIGGDSPRLRGNKLTIEDVEEIDLYLLNTTHSHGQIANIFNVSSEIIQGINTGRYWYRDEIAYPIRKPIVAKKHYCIVCGKEISKDALYCMDCWRLQSRIVERPSREQLLEDLLQSNFTAVGTKYGVTDNTIRKWCKTYDIPSSAKEIKALKEKLNPSKKPKNPNNTGKKKIVEKISNGQVVEIFESASAAARSMGVSDGTHISACCRGERPSAYGYVWRYKK